MQPTEVNAVVPDHVRSGFAHYITIIFVWGITRSAKFQLTAIPIFAPEWGHGDTNCAVLQTQAWHRPGPQQLDLVTVRMETRLLCRLFQPNWPKWSMAATVVAKLGESQTPGRAAKPCLVSSISMCTIYCTYHHSNPLEKEGHTGKQISDVFLQRATLISTGVISVYGMQDHTYIYLHWAIT